MDLPSPKCKACKKCDDTHIVVPENSSSPCSSNTRNCEACMRVNKLTSEVEEAAERLKQLIAALQNAKNEMNYHHSSVVKKLPPEILSTIFESYVSDALSLTLPQDGGVFEALQHQVLPIPLILSNICHRWREVALSTPQIWTSFALSLDLCRGSLGSELMRAWVSRTRNHPLTIHLYSSLKEDYSSSLPDPSRLPILRILAGSSGQWRLSNIRVPLYVLHYLGTQLQRIPLIKTLGITLHSPVVQFVSLQNELWRAVTTLRVANIDTEECAMLFCSAPNLKTCIFEEVMSMDEFTWTNPLIEHKMQHLTYDSAECCQIFSHLKFPELRSLAFVTGVEELSTVLPVFIANSGLKKLEALRLPDIFSSDELESLLSTIPTIKHFFLSCFENSGQSAISRLLQCLGSSNPDDAAFLPNLTSLEFKVHVPYFPWHLVSRCFPGNRCRPLTTLKVVTTMECEDIDVEGEFELMIFVRTLADLLALMERGVDIIFEEEDGTDLFKESMLHAKMDLKLCPRYQHDAAKRALGVQWIEYDASAYGI